jgi:RNA polymerase primary sigma factor
MKKIKNWNDYRKRKDEQDENLVYHFLLAEVKGDDREKALSEIINMNLNTAHHYALKYNWCNIQYDDLLAHAITGIISAADNFDISHKTKFNTYCTHYIIGRIKRALEQHNHLIRIPAHINLAAYKINALDFDKEITDEELNDFTSERYKLHHLRQAIETKKHTFLNVEDVHNLSEPKQNSSDIKMIVDDMLNLLNNNERIAIVLKFGLKNEEIHTLKEIDKVLDVDAENTLINAFNKIRKNYSEYEMLDLLKYE